MSRRRAPKSSASRTRSPHFWAPFRTTARSQLGVKALDHIHNKLKTLAQDNRFKPEERQFLTDHWKKFEAQTEGATKELDDARAQFVGLLHTLQDNEDFIGELLEIRH